MRNPFQKKLPIGLNIWGNNPSNKVIFCVTGKRDIIAFIAYRRDIAKRNIEVNFLNGQIRYR